MSDMQYEIANKAFAKIMLHIMKNANSDCYGALIGRVVNSKLVINDAMPMFHDRVFTPQSEIALKLVILIL